MSKGKMTSQVRGSNVRSKEKHKFNIGKRVIEKHDDEEYKDFEETLVFIGIICFLVGYYFCKFVHGLL